MKQENHHHSCLSIGQDCSVFTFPTKQSYIVHGDQSVVMNITYVDIHEKEVRSSNPLYVHNSYHLRCSSLYVPSIYILHMDNYFSFSQSPKTAVMKKCRQVPSSLDILMDTLTVMKRNVNLQHLKSHTHTHTHGHGHGLRSSHL